MTQTAETSRIGTQRRGVGWADRRRFTQTCWWRFCPGSAPGLANLALPRTKRQGLANRFPRSSGMGALKVEAEGTLQGDRNREHRRSFDRFLADFERSLA